MIKMNFRTTPMKYLTLLVFIVPFSTFSQSESSISDSIAVRNVIDQLFEGMRLGDSTMVKETFAREIQMVTTFTDNKGNQRVIQGSAAEFKKSVGTPHDKVWDERITNVIIRIDDNLAQVWMDYSFYADHEFSHCGVNAMQLVKTPTGWKIQHLADTRRKSNCNADLD